MPNKATVRREGEMITICDEKGVRLMTLKAIDLETGRESWKSLLECGYSEAANELNGMLKQEHELRALRVQLLSSLTEMTVTGK